MSIVDAAVLCMTSLYTERGWNKMADSINSALNPSKNKKNFVPGFKAIQSELKWMGTELEMEDIKVVHMRAHEYGVMDLTEDDSLTSDRDVWRISDTSSIDPPAADLRGVYVKDVMHQVSRELFRISETMPRGVHQHMTKE
jgi:hypothetical protein